MIADRYDIYTAFYFLAGTIVFANLLVFFLPKPSRFRQTRRASEARPFALMYIRVNGCAAKAQCLCFYTSARTD